MSKKQKSGARCPFCPGLIFARYRQKKSPTFRCRLCRRIHVPIVWAEPYVPGLAT